MAASIPRRFQPALTVGHSGVKKKPQVGNFFAPQSYVLVILTPSNHQYCKFYAHLFSEVLPDLLPLKSTGRQPIIELRVEDNERKEKLIRRVDRSNPEGAWRAESPNEEMLAHALLKASPEPEKIQSPAHPRRIGINTKVESGETSMPIKINHNDSGNLELISKLMDSAAKKYNCRVTYDAANSAIQFSGNRDHTRTIAEETAGWFKK
jgi:hypothetical protein